MKLSHNTRTVYWLWFAFVLYEFILWKPCKSIIFFIHGEHKPVSIWKWIQKYKPKKKIGSNKRRIYEYVIDDTVIKPGSGCTWLWIAIEKKDK